ncbi:MAG: TetR/AcrR family transcriptional regulator [Acidobacteriota bacterium]
MSKRAPRSSEGQPPAQYHHGDLRAALVKSATEILEESGPGALSLRSVARAAGVSHAAPYRHFKDRHELLEAVAAAGFRALETGLDDIADRFPDDPRRQLHAACRVYVRENLGHPHRANLMFGGFLDAGRRSEELDTAVNESFAKLVATLRRGEGRLYRSMPARQLVLTLWSATHGFTLLALSGQLEAFDPNADVEERLTQVLEHILAGLARPPAPAS